MSTGRCAWIWKNWWDPIRCEMSRYIAGRAYGARSIFTRESNGPKNMASNKNKNQINTRNRGANKKEANSLAAKMLAPTTITKCNECVRKMDRHIPGRFPAILCAHLTGSSLLAVALIRQIAAAICPPISAAFVVTTAIFGSAYWTAWYPIISWFLQLDVIFLLKFGSKKNGRICEKR